MPDSVLGTRDTTLNNTEMDVCMGPILNKWETENK